MKMKFINRTEEIQYLRYYFTHEPNSLLFVSGPKSSGKSVLLEKVVNELDKEMFVIHFMDLRRIVIYDFKSFLDTFFIKDLKGKIQDVLRGITINIPLKVISLKKFTTAQSSKKQLRGHFFIGENNGSIL